MTIMTKLMEYTGGSIILTALFMLGELIGLALILVNLFLGLSKNAYIEKNKKIEYVICIISGIVITLIIGGVSGYYFGIVQSL